MGKLFGYPEFDENGEKILTTYDNDYKDMLMDIRVYRMKAGDTKEFFKPEEEMAVIPSGVPYFNVDFIGGFELIVNDQTHICAPT